MQIPIPSKRDNIYKMIWKIILCPINLRKYWGRSLLYHPHDYYISSLKRQWHSTPVLLPGKSHGHRSLEGCSPWGCQGSDTTERLHFHFSLSYTGEGNGNWLQCSCLENLRDDRAWWTTVYGVAHSQTRLKWLSSCRIGATLEQHHGYVIWGYAVTMLLLHYGYIMADYTASA